MPAACASSPLLPRPRRAPEAAAARSRRSRRRAAGCERRTDAGCAGVLDHARPPGAPREPSGGSGAGASAPSPIAGCVGGLRRRSVVATDPPGWMTTSTPAAIASSGPSAKGKNASEASAAPCRRVRPRLLDREAHRVDAAHLARRRSRPSRGRARARSRWSSRACTPARRTACSLHSASVGWRADTTCISLALLGVQVAVLDEQAAAGPGVICRLAGERHAALLVLRGSARSGARRAPRAPSSS